MNKELEELKEYLEHEVKVYENNKEINQLIGGKLGEKQHKINKILLNYIDNSIPRKIIEEKIEKYEQRLKNNTKRVVQLQVLEQNKSLQQSEWEELNMLFGDIEKIRGKLEVLQELLGGK